MIERLQLQNWRAYDNLDLEFGPGATYVVASNGIGKTSLIMGAAWGLLGDAAEVDAAEQIRGDAEGATVGVVLRLSSGASLTISRSVDRRGRMELAAELAGRVITTQDELDELLATESGADVHVMGQLTFMIHGGSLETAQGEFQLRDHLASVFGVTPLFQAAAAAEATAASAAGTLRKLKTTQRSEKRAREQLVAEMQSLDQQLVTAHEQRGLAVAAMNEAAERLRAAEEWIRFHASLEERRNKLDSLADQAGSLLQASVAFDDVTDLLERAERELEDSISTAESEAATARGKADLIEQAMSQLGDSEAVCPTCLRPLSQHDADKAEQEHRKHLADLAAVMTEADDAASRHRDSLRDTRQLLMKIRALPVPAAPDSDAGDKDADTTREEFQQARDEVQEFDQLIAMHSASKKSLEDALTTLDEDERRVQEQVNLYREEGLARAAADAFMTAGSAITKEFIEPLVSEVAMRWKRIFGSGGLNLSPEGRITRSVGDRVLGFESLSGGEKVWAQLLTRLLVSGASTRAPFVWLDEPLEHLDPRLRKVVAGTLAKAASGAGLRQVIVTTYESELALQLVEDVPSASLIYVTTST
ncbi:MAG: AAA family ATPase [Actinomycetota bacterium]